MVSLRIPLRRSLAIEKVKIGGTALTPMKELNGAMFARPSASAVETQAMGRGTMHPLSSL